MNSNKNTILEKIGYYRNLLNQSTHKFHHKKEVILQRSGKKEFRQIHVSSNSGKDNLVQKEIAQILRQSHKEENTSTLQMLRENSFIEPQSNPPQSKGSEAYSTLELDKLSQEQVPFIDIKELDSEKPSVTPPLIIRDAKHNKKLLHNDEGKSSEQTPNKFNSKLNFSYRQSASQKNQPSGRRATATPGSSHRNYATFRGSENNKSSLGMSQRRISYGIPEDSYQSMMMNQTFGPNTFKRMTALQATKDLEIKEADRRIRKLKQKIWEVRGNTLTSLKSMNLKVKLPETFFNPRVCRSLASSCKQRIPNKEYFGLKRESEDLCNLDFEDESSENGNLVGLDCRNIIGKRYISHDVRTQASKTFYPNYTQKNHLFIPVRNLEPLQISSKTEYIMNTHSSKGNNAQIKIQNQTNSPEDSSPVLHPAQTTKISHFGNMFFEDQKDAYQASKIRAASSTMNTRRFAPLCSSLERKISNRHKLVNISIDGKTPINYFLPPKKYTPLNSSYRVSRYTKSQTSRRKPMEKRKNPIPQLNSINLENTHTDVFSQEYITSEYRDLKNEIGSSIINDDTTSDIPAVLNF